MSGVSVIVIGYNIEQYIKRCLESIFRQDYSDYEVIFVNDGSTDHTSEIARAYIKTHENYQVIDKENGGIISARKEGVKAAQKDYILFVDGDDYINDGMLSSFLSAAEQNDDGYDIILSDHFEERPSGRIINRTSQCSYGELRDDLYIRGILDGTLNHFMFAKLYKRDFLIRHGYLRYPNITIAEDLLTNTTLGLYMPKVLYIEDTNYYYQFNETSVTRDGKLSVVDKQLYTLRLLKKKVRLVSADKYKDYIDYQLYLFAIGYLQTNYSHTFKKYLVSKCKIGIKGIRKNHIYREQKINLSVLYGRTMLFLYMYVPFTAAAMNSGVRFLISFLHKLKLLKKY